MNAAAYRKALIVAIEGVGRPHMADATREMRMSVFIGVLADLLQAEGADAALLERLEYVRRHEVPAA